MSKKTKSTAISKVVVAFLIGAFLAPLAFASGGKDVGVTGEESILNETGYPIVSEPLTLKGISYMRTFHGDWDEMLVWELYEEKTGVHIDWNLIPWPERTTKTTIILASGDLPDFFMSIRVSLSEVLKYSKQGAFIRLNELIDKYGTNIKKMYERYPEVRRGTTTPEGDIFYVTNVQGLYRLVPLYVNKIWMENLGLQYPETTEDYYNILKAFKENDANGNGDSNDELPLAGMSSLPIKSVYGSWGLGNRGYTASGGSFYGYDLGPDGKVRLIAMDPRFKEVLQYFNRLWSDGLIDQEIFTTSMSQFTAKGEALEVGSFQFTNTTPVGRGQMNDYKGVIFTGPHGDKISSTRVSGIGNPAMVITSQSEYPEVIMRCIA